MIIGRRHHGPPGNREDQRSSPQNDERIQEVAGWKTSPWTAALPCAGRLTPGLKATGKWTLVTEAMRQNLRTPLTEKCRASGCRPANLAEQSRKTAEGMEKHFTFWMTRQNYQEVSSHKNYHRLNMIKEPMRLFLKLDKIIPILFWKNKQVTRTKLWKMRGLAFISF